MSGNPGYNRLMHDLCVGHGWCGGIVDDQPSHVDDFVPETGTVTADQFVDWLFLAEGIDPESGDADRFRDRLKAVFVRHMGAATVDAAALKWDL